MTVIYRTQERPGFSKNSHVWNEYRLEGETVAKYKCSRFKFFDGKENNWEHDESFQQSWELDDAAMPDWLRQYL